MRPYDCVKARGAPVCLKPLAEGLAMSKGGIHGGSKLVTAAFNAAPDCGE